MIEKIIIIAIVSIILFLGIRKYYRIFKGKGSACSCGEKNMKMKTKGSKSGCGQTCSACSSFKYVGDGSNPKSKNSENMSHDKS